MSILKKIFKRKKDILERWQIRRDYQHTTRESLSDEQRLRLTMEWLGRAQDASGVGGISAGYDVRAKRWLAPYRETTGYSIPTFLAYAKATNQPAWKERALQMGVFELEVQEQDGSIGEIGKDGTIVKKIFNTGQVLLGLCALFEETKDPKYLAAAQRAGAWLISQQESDGSWRKHTTEGARTYHARVAWPLLILATHSENKEYYESALAALRWVLARQQINGWFTDTGLTIAGSSETLTHFIGYTLSGLLESQALVPELLRQEIHQALMANAWQIVKYIENQKAAALLPAFFDAAWRGHGSFSCLTGTAQLAIVLLKLNEQVSEPRFVAAAEHLIKQVAATQVTGGIVPELIGGIAGSSPIDALYCPSTLINWAAKFFADALLIKNYPTVSFYS